MAVAGGTSLAFSKGPSGKVAVDITRLGLEGIRSDSECFTIGASTRIADLQDYRAPGWVLDRVARNLATQQVRNMSTLGGNLARVFRWNDFPVALLALDTSMTLQGDAQRVIEGSKYLAQQPAQLFQPGDLLTSVRVQRLPARSGFGYRKEVRTCADFSLVTAAAVIEVEGASIKRARIAVGAALPFPRRLTKLESMLTGRSIAKGGFGENAFMKIVADGTADTDWKGQAGHSDEYTGRLAVVAIRDAVEEAAIEAVGS